MRVARSSWTRCCSSRPRIRTTSRITTWGSCATHDDHRGRGIGEQLLAQNLALIDAEHRPAYLESTNPRNLARYGRLGFVPREEFTLPDDGPTVTTMWRAAR